VTVDKLGRVKIDAGSKNEIIEKYKGNIMEEAN
jgi:hypothetical protein